MEKLDKESVIKRYADRLQQFGATARGLGWRDEDQQHLRFKILNQIGDLNGQSVLDVGCGFGDFYTYLKDLDINTKYHGIDISPDVLLEARRRHSNLEFSEADLLSDNSGRRYDYVIESGVFNYRVENNEQFVQEMLATMYERCEVGIAANMMTSYVDYRDEHLYYYDPKTIFEFAEKMSRYVTIRHDYPLYEFTLFVYRKVL